MSSSDTSIQSEKYITLFEEQKNWIQEQSNELISFITNNEFINSIEACVINGLDSCPVKTWCDNDTFYGISTFEMIAGTDEKEKLPNGKSVIQLASESLSDFSHLKNLSLDFYDGDFMTLTCVIIWDHENYSLCVNKFKKENVSFDEYYR